MSCRNCSNSYDHSKHQPFSLSCIMHTFCLDCVNKMSECPVKDCKKPVTDKKINLELLELIPKSNYDNLKFKAESLIEEIRRKEMHVNEKCDDKVRKLMKRIHLLKEKINNTMNSIRNAFTQCELKLVESVNNLETNLKINLNKIKINQLIYERFADKIGNLNANNFNECELKSLQDQLNILKTNANTKESQFDEQGNHIENISNLVVFFENNFLNEINSKVKQLMEECLKKKNDSYLFAKENANGSISRLLHSPVRVNLASKEINLNSHIIALTCLSNGLIAAGSADKMVRIYNADNGLLIKTLVGHSLAITALTCSCCFLASASYDCTVRIWNQNDWILTHCLPTQNSAILKLTFATKDRLIGSCSDLGVKIWDPAQGILMQSFEHLHKKKINALITLGCGLVASGSDDTSIKIWEPFGAGKIKTTLTGSSSVCSLTELPNGFLISGYEDKIIKIWNREDANLLLQFIAHNGPIMALETLNTYDFVSCSSDKIIKIWSMKSEHKGIIKVLHGHTDEITCLVNLTNLRLASSSMDNTLKIWNLN